MKIPVILWPATKPEPALRSDAGRWVGQGAVLVHEGPEVFSDVGLGGAVFHGNIMAAKFQEMNRPIWNTLAARVTGRSRTLASKGNARGL
jgi:hypothetical protein